MLIEIHSDMKSTVSTVENLVKEVWGGNGKDGAVKDITLLQERQEACPARVANSVENRRLKVSHVMIIIAIISLLASIALGVMNLSN